MSFENVSRRRRLIAQLIAILAIFSLIAAACGDDDEGADDSTDSSDDSSDDGMDGPADLDPNGTLQFATNFETWFGTGFDPATAIAPGNFFGEWIYGTLLRRDGSYNYSSGLADIDATKITNPQTIEVTLFPNQQFHDGTALTAQHVADAIERVALKGNGRNSRQGQLAAIKGQDGDGNTIVAEGALDVTGDLTMTINLSQPIAGAFFDLLAHEETMPVLLPDVEDDPDTDTDEVALAIQENPIGAGPYDFVDGSFKTNDEFVLVKNENYVHADMIHIPNIIVRHVTAEATANALNNGDLDWLESSITIAEEITNDDYDYFQLNNPDRFGWLWLSCMAPFDFAARGEGADQPRVDDNGDPHPLTDVRVRQALNYALDKQDLTNKGLAGLDTSTIPVMNQLWPDDSKYADPALVGIYDQDIQKAKDLLAEAGYAEGLKFSIVSAGAGATEVTANLLQAAWAEIGVELEIRVTQDVVTDFYAGRVIDFNGSLAGSSARFFTDKITRNWLHPSVGATCQPDSEAVGGDPRFREATNELQGLAPDDEDTIPLWREVSKIVMEGAFGIFFNYPPSLVILNEAKFGVYATGDPYTGELSTIAPTQVGIYYPDVHQIYVRTS